MGIVTRGSPHHVQSAGASVGGRAEHHELKVVVLRDIRNTGQIGNRARDIREVINSPKLFLDPVIGRLKRSDDH